MLSFTQDRLTKYPVVVRAKVSQEQKRALDRLSKRTNRHVSEIIRDAIKSALEAGEDSEMQLCLEMLQMLRSEVLAVCSGLLPATNIKQLVAESEQVAPHELEQLKERRARRMDLVKALGVGE